ncbi:SCO family protein [Actinomarinicola tropica]|uniref:SCO family protein n=1 Tax=Actinomarinicola tropica TaxID=2789776 RepID=A0A5Q2RGD3_9ACTN|nr:SCO family protein [Actinomarinicola tropica]QGG95879.1 SCO family protein [Actinomarinicola tropica]
MTALLLVVGTAACGDDGGTADDGGPPALEGITRASPISVADIEITEVAPDAPDRPFRFRAPDGELLFVYFGYTSCPDVCPLTLSDLRAALEELDPADASRLSVAFVTVDPERDTAEVLVPYLGHFFDRIHALRTEDAAVLQEVEDAFGASSTITPKDDGTYDVSHSAISYLVDSDGEVVVEWPYGVSSDAMAHDLRILTDRLTEEQTT